MPRTDPDPLRFIQVGADIPPSSPTRAGRLRSPEDRALPLTESDNPRAETATGAAHLSDSDASDKGRFSDANGAAAGAFPMLPALSVKPLGEQPQSAAPAGLAQLLGDAELRADVEGAYSLNTMRAYRADWRDWTAWCQRQGKTALPADARDLRDYLADLAVGRKVATLRRRLAAITRAHKLAGYQLDRTAPAVYHVMRRLARQKGTAPNGRAQLMTADIIALVKATGPDLRGARDRAILLLGFAAGLRRSELVALKVNDIDWLRNGIVVHIRSSKTDQEGKGQTVSVVHGKRESSCPVRALRRWLDQARIGDGPIFRAIAGDTVGAGSLAPERVYLTVKRLAVKAGLDPARLGAHSLRVGHVTQALENGADVVKTKEQLRHKRIDTTLGYNRGRSFKGSSSAKLGL